MADIETILKSRPPLSVKLDWCAYYREFDRLHRGDPVIHQGRLLFRDGWMYSATDYRGPEWAPPKDEARLRELIAAYWHTRKEIMQDEYKDLILKVRSLREAQELRSAPLQQVRLLINDKTGIPLPMRDPDNPYESVDIDLLQGRLDWLHDQLQECERREAALAQGSLGDF